MARLIFPDGSEMLDFEGIRDKLAGLGITLRRWPAPDSETARELLEKSALDETEKETLLREVDNRFEQLKQEAGYTTRDLIVIHEDIPGLSDMLAKFEKIHYHSDDEVRYILSGKGYFGFVEADGEQFMLEVNEGDYINVPADAEHWFTMRDSKRIKAVRYFIDTSGWTPHYTDRQLMFG
jgi:1,2-dihydroxy-3-keto-5-methylthiopentene dioxygenase